MMSTTIRLPFPPSVNGTFRRHNGSHLSKRYRDWRDEATVALLQQHPRPIPGQVEIDVAFRAPDRRRRDIDNLFKGVLDLLVKNGLIEDDDNRFVRSIAARWVDDGAPCTVTVRRAAA